MALWTDLQFVNLTDLAGVDSEVSDVATNNGSDGTPIDVNGTIIPQAIKEAGVEMIVNMQRFGGFLSSGALSPNHLSAVFNVGGPGVSRARILLSQIIVDDLQVSTVKNWVIYRSLINFYRDAYARTKEDRYEKKMRQFDTDVRRRYWPQLKAIGLPIVYKPLACPAAILERSGSWSSSNVAPVTAVGTAGGTFYVVITYVDQTVYLGPLYGTGANAANQGESYWSAAQSVTTTAGQAISVNISSLIPPNGQVDPASLALAIVTSGNASGWNLYVGASPTGPFYMQNNGVIPITQKIYSLTTDPVLSGNTPNPMFVDAYYTFQETLQRA